MRRISTSSTFDERYLIVAGACLTQFTVIGLLFSYGLFFKPLEAEFGWSRTLLSSCTSIAFLVMGILAVFGGRLADRYGPRVVLSVAGTMCGLGYALLSQVSAPWHLFVLFGLFIGVGMSTHDVVTLSTIARWFHLRRGVMTGVVKVGTAAGQVAVPPIAAFLIAGQGWRGALIIMGSVAIALLLAAALVVKHPPEPRGVVEAAETPGQSFAEARRTGALWMLCAIQFLFFPTLTTVPLHIVVHGMDLGMTTALAAALLSAMGAASVIGRLATGSAFDRIGGKNSLILCFVPLIASLVALLFIQTAWMLFAIVVIYGFAHGGFFTVISPIIAEHFGLRAHGGLFGLVLFFGAIGGAVGPMLAGYIFDVTQSYAPAFTTLAVMATLGLALTMMLPSPTRAAKQ